MQGGAERERVSESFKEAVEEFHRYSYASPSTFLDYVPDTSPLHHTIASQPRWHWDKRRGLIYSAGGGDCDVFAFHLASRLKEKGYQPFISYPAPSHTEVGLWVGDTILYFSPSNHGMTVIQSPLLRDRESFKRTFPLLYHLLFFRNAGVLAAYLSLKTGEPLEKVKKKVEQQLKIELMKLRTTPEGRKLADQIERWNIWDDKYSEWAYSYFKKMFEAGLLRKEDPFYFKPMKARPKAFSLPPLTQGEYEALRYVNRILMNQAVSPAFSHMQEERSSPYFTLTVNLSGVAEDLERYKLREVLRKKVPKEVLDLYQSIGVWKGGTATYEDLIVYATAFRYALDLYSARKDVATALEKAREFASRILELYREGKKVSPSYTMKDLAREIPFLLA